MLVLASITDPIVNFADVVEAMGLGVFLLMVAESACIPIPPRRRCSSPASTCPRASTRSGRRRWSPRWPTWLPWIAYAVGYYGRVDILEKHGKKLHISPKHLAWADRWFERYGDATVFFTRLLPIIRTFISLPAGVARMPFWRFTLLTFAGACRGCSC